MRAGVVTVAQKRTPRLGRVECWQLKCELIGVPLKKRAGDVIDLTLRANVKAVQALGGG